MKKPGSFSQSQTYALRSHIAQLRDRAFGLDRQTYFPPEPAPPGANKGAAWLMDPAFDPPLPHWTHQEREAVLKSKHLSRLAKAKGLF